ncbi:40s ribosomal protein [Cyclospora cayetanensis]|uniref:40s ribosomal protein n=1 Tax=Cyclospora cayetanensis TaxID=88456 RepID=A0A1D3CR80_9EIME|nr:40s ribosomal protein [Cyclospora cayetanensis]
MSNPELISLNLSLAKRRQLWEVRGPVPTHEGLGERRPLCLETDSNNSSLSSFASAHFSLQQKWCVFSPLLPSPIFLCVVSADATQLSIFLPSSQSFSVEKAEDASAPRKRTFRTFSYRGVDLEKLVTLPLDKLVDLLRARQRRKFSRGINMKALPLMNKLRNAKKHLPYGEKPPVVNTHLRNVVVVPEMIGSVIGIYNGKQFINVEIKPEMVGYYLGEFSMSYKPVRHGKPGIGATHSSRFIPLK